jgi:transcriptional regulator of acetoin/glycerol metabolism
MAKKTNISIEDIKDQFLHIEDSYNGIDDNAVLKNTVGKAKNYTPEKSLNIAENEKLSIRRALENTNGSILNAAKELGISRTTLWRKIKKYNIHVSD